MPTGSQSIYGQPGRYNSSLPTLNNGQGAALAVDVNGKILISGSGTLTNNNAAPGTTNTGVLPALANAAAPTWTEGNQVLESVDLSGNQRITAGTLFAGEDLTAGVQGVLMKPIASSIYAPSTYQQSGSVTKANIKATTGNVYSIRITNANAAVRYFQLHNKATAPAAADTAQLYYIVPAGTATAPGTLELSSSHFAPSEYFSTGIGWAISTTATTFTDSATAGEHNTTVRYT